jgi:uncharacterized protein (TIGR03437 family)
MDQSRRIIAQVPGGVSTGPVSIQLTGGGESVAPILVQIDDPPPVILQMEAPPGQVLGRVALLKPGDRMLLVVADLSGPSSPASLANIVVTVAGVPHVPDVMRDGDQPGLSEIEFVLRGDVPPGAAQPLTVGVGTRISARNIIAVQPAE